MYWLENLVSKFMERHGKMIHFLAVMCIAVVATLALVIYLVPEEKDNVFTQAIFIVALVYVVFYVHIVIHLLHTRAKKRINDMLGTK